VDGHRPDPSGRDDWDVDAGKRLLEDLVEWLRPADMAAGLDPLGHHEVATSLHGGDGLNGRAGLPPDQRAVSPGDANAIGIWIAAEELDDLDRPGGGLKRIAGKKGDQEADSDRLSGEGSRIFHAPLDVRSGRRVRNHPQTAGLRDRSRELRRPYRSSQQSQLDREPATDEGVKLRLAAIPRRT